MDDLLVRPTPRPLEAPTRPRRALFPRPSGPRRSGSSPPRFEGAREAWERLRGWERFDFPLLFLLAAFALGLRWRTMGASYWGDEAIAIGIAAHPIGSLPHYLANDGSPPLYYVMLHFWMELFGRSEPATHALSMVAGLLAIPAAWWSGRRLFGCQAARWAAALVATCAYLDYYSTETRMYSWLVLAALLAITCFVLAYRGAGRGYWVAATLLMSSVLYLQYYGLYLLVATVIVGAVAARKSGSREHLRATVSYGLACALAFAPWAPQFLYQLYNTGAPWAPHPSVLDFFGDSFNALASAAWAAVVVAMVVAVLGRRRPQLDYPTTGAAPRPGAVPVSSGPTEPRPGWSRRWPWPPPSRCSQCYWPGSSARSSTPGTPGTWASRWSPPSSPWRAGWSGCGGAAWSWAGPWQHSPSRLSRWSSTAPSPSRLPRATLLTCSTGYDRTSSQAPW